MSPVGGSAGRSIGTGNPCQQPQKTVLDTSHRRGKAADASIQKFAGMIGTAGRI
jgi:hypothetical protein